MVRFILSHSIEEGTVAYRFERPMKHPDFLLDDFDSLFSELSEESSAK